MPERIASIISLYRTRGAVREGVKDISQEQHALQCALLAQQAGADTNLVAAALLHDLGHVLAAPGSDAAPGEDRHELRALDFLRGAFPRSVLDPIRLHVAAKRYLCARNAGYWDRLSPASKRSLDLQGGPFAAREIDLFLREPHACDAIALRQWDDLARNPTGCTAGWEHFRRVLERASLHEAESLAA